MYAALSLPNAYYNTVDMLMTKNVFVRLPPPSSTSPGFRFFFFYLKITSLAVSDLNHLVDYSVVFA